MSFRIIIEEERKFAGDFDPPGLIKGSLASLILHGSILFLVAFFTHQQAQNELKLTEITMVEQIIPIPEEKAPPPPPIPMPKEKTNVWDFLKQAIPLKKAPELASKLPMELPKKADVPKLSSMPEALKLGSKKNLDKPSMANEPLDLVGKKAVRAPAGMNVNPLQMNRKKTSLAQTAHLPKGISLGRKSSFSSSMQAPVLNTQRFAKRANLQARGGSLMDMPAIKKKKVEKKVDLSGAGLNMKRNQNTFQVFGEIANRKRLKMFMPRYPRWAEEQGIECTVSVHLFVLPNGNVKNNLYVEQGSGYGEIDNLAMEALKRFKFAPLMPSERQVEQEGTIVFYFRLSR
jgi:TonB family protein